MTARCRCGCRALEAEDDARPVHLFAAGNWRAVSYDRDATRIPPPPGLAWRYERLVPLGVHHVVLPGSEPEPALTGLLAKGYYVWRLAPDEEARL